MTFSDDYVRPRRARRRCLRQVDARTLLLVLCIQQRRDVRSSPSCSPRSTSCASSSRTLRGDYIDGYLRSVYGPRSRRYLFLKQAMLERRLVLFLDGMDEVPTGLKSVVEAHVMTAARMCCRIVMTSRPGGFNKAWLDECITMKILPLDVAQQEVVALARLHTPEHLAMFKGLMERPDLQQLASNPLILSMVLSYIRSASRAPRPPQPVAPLPRRHVDHHHAARRQDSRGTQGAGRALVGGLPLAVAGDRLPRTASRPRTSTPRVLRSAITEQTAALADDVRESVARGQFAVLTSFVENDETIYRFGHLTFQEHLCSMLINSMIGEELERVKSILASAGLRKMLQGSWWLTVTQFCLEGLSIDAERGTERGAQLAHRFADAMLDDVTDAHGVVRIGSAELHSYDSMAAFSSSSSTRRRSPRSRSATASRT